LKKGEVLVGVLQPVCRSLDNLSFLAVKNPSTIPIET